MNLRSKPFDRLMALHPWPNEPDIRDVEPFTWMLDGGGRHLVDAVIAARSPCLLIEIGSFMGGATRRWLGKFPDLRCVCVDPWGPNLVEYVARLDQVEWAVNSYGVDALRHYAKLLKKYGPMRVVQNNLAEFRDRCVLLQMGVPEAFIYMADVAGVKPDIVFLDAMKRQEEFVGADAAFPDTLVCGDDWSWKDKSGDFPVRRFASEVATRRVGRIFADRATFVITEPRHKLALDEKYAVDS